MRKKRAKEEAEEETLPFVTFYYVKRGAEIIAEAYTNIVGWQEGVFYCPFCEFKTGRLPYPVAVAKGRDHILTHIAEKRRLLVLRP